MAEFLELVMPIVDENNKATPYFEDYLFQIIQSVGGENSLNLDDVQALIKSQSSAKINKNTGDIKALINSIKPVNNTKINKNAKNIESLHSLISPTNNAKINNNTRSIESLRNLARPNNNAKISNQGKTINGLLQLVSQLMTSNGRLQAKINSLTLKGIEIPAGGVALTTSGNQRIICNNTDPAIITLNASPKGGERLQIIRRDAGISIAGIINGSTPTSIPSKYDILDLVYTNFGGWSA